MDMNVQLQKELTLMKEEFAQNVLHLIITADFSNPVKSVLVEDSNPTSLL